MLLGLDGQNQHAVHPHRPTSPRRRYLAGLLLLLSTVALATYQIWFAVAVFVIGLVLIVTSYDWRNR